MHSDRCYIDRVKRARGRRSSPAAEPPVVVGWREYVRLPDWGLSGVLAKIDTGALSSAVDVSVIERLDDDHVRFKVVKDRASHKRRTIEAPVVRSAVVRPSHGEARPRLFVRTRVVIAGRTLEVDLGLVDRGAMECRMLLGRRDLAPWFLVDPSRCYLHGRRRRRPRR